MDDLASLDPELYQGLIFLKNHAGNVESDLSLNFTVTDEGEACIEHIDRSLVTYCVCILTFVQTLASRERLI